MAVKAGKNPEPQPSASAELETIEVPTSTYLAIQSPARIKEQLSITLSNHSYYPSVHNLPSDWVAHVAAPAFKLYRAQRNDAPIDSFCSIGTGSGLDVLSAVEILGAKRVGLTDVHQDVVATAADNVRRNHLATHKLVVESGFGDLLAPLAPFKPRYDLIYENLPNVPLTNPEEIQRAQKSSTHLVARSEAIPELVRQQMLDLHYLALAQAKDYLSTGGAVLSTLGGRVPLEVFLTLAKLAGFHASVLAYTWKVQADPAGIIHDYAKKQQEGFGPFYFYRAEVLAKVFAALDYTTSGQNAFDIEKSLLPERFDAVQAAAYLDKGETLGHTVVVLKSELR